METLSLRCTDMFAVVTFSTVVDMVEEENVKSAWGKFGRINLTERCESRSFQLPHACLVKRRKR